jgi:outer membrane receptor for ferrienterochelin and colicins
MRSVFVLILVTAAVVRPTLAFAQAGALVGVVRDGAGRPLEGARVEATAAGGAAGGRTRTGDDGRFGLGALAAGTYQVRIARIGSRAWRSDTVHVAAGGPTSLAVTLEEIASPLNSIVVSVSRRQEKAIDAPAAITVIDASAIEERPTLSPVEHVADVPGVDIARSGLLQSSVVARGFNDVFSGSLLFLTDNRYNFVPSLRVNAPWLIPTPNVDIERIEVVLGPAAALYGPNAAAGVLHIITKSPFDDQSTVLGLGGLSRAANDAGGAGALGRATLRHAGTVGSAVGYKLAAEYADGRDWPMEDSTELNTRRAAIALGALPDTLRIGRREFTVRRWNVEGRVDVRPRDGAELVVGAGRTYAGSAIELTGLGAAQVRDWSFDFYHLRARVGQLFGQLFLNSSNAGSTFLLRTGQPIVDKSRMMVGQVQHVVDLGARETVTYGIDAQYTQPRTEGTITGRNESDDDIRELGGYVHTETRLSPQLQFVAALRMDEHNRLPHPVVSPRAAIVFKPSSDHTFRLTYNRAFETPGTNSLFLDVVAGSLAPLPYQVRAIGVPTGGLTFRRDCPGGLCMRSPLGGQPTQSLPVDATLFWPAIVQLVQASGGPDLSRIPPPTAGDVRSVLRALNPADLTFSDVAPAAVNDIPALRETLTNTIEAGYKGVIGDRLSLAVNVYYERKNNFVGPLTVATPNVFLEAGVLGAPGTLATYLARFLPAAQAQQIALLVGGVSGSATARGIPVGTVAPENALTSGSDIVLSYRNFGALHRWGSDIGAHLSLTDRVALTGTYSITTKDLFPSAEVGGLSDIALNAPRTKGSLGVHFSDEGSGASAGLTARHVAGFPMNSGVFVGEVKPYTVADAQAAYRLKGSEMTLSLAIQNLLDYQHREFVGAPTLGRFAMLQAEYRLR